MNIVKDSQTITILEREMEQSPKEMGRPRIVVTKAVLDQWRHCICKKNCIRGQPDGPPNTTGRPSTLAGRTQVVSIPPGAHASTDIPSFPIKKGQNRRPLISSATLFMLHIQF